ncbi:MAG: membrane protein insertion efficiency factor YidD [Candidatus Eremiobacteraeota bacterium]|nr:membrane protein insertion efficiency factor YidD [Candidatus Eremiobacteraeota bacterium]
MGDSDSREGHEQGVELPVSEKTNSETTEQAQGVSLAGRIALKLIAGYQKFSRYTPPSCRFTPTCSEYTRQSIVKYGFFKGAAMGAWRICRCNPFVEGGHDPVP